MASTRTFSLPQLQFLRSLARALGIQRIALISLSEEAIGTWEQLAWSQAKETSARHFLGPYWYVYGKKPCSILLKEPLSPFHYLWRLLRLKAKGTTEHFDDTSLRDYRLIAGNWNCHWPLPLLKKLDPPLVEQAKPQTLSRKHFDIPTDGSDLSFQICPLSLVP